MRNISSTIQAVLNSSYGETRDVVEIAIKAQVTPPLPATVLYYANGDGIVVNGQAYQNKLRGIGTTKFSLGSSPDGTEITLENVSRDLGFLLTDSERVFDGSIVTFKKIFKVADGSWEPKTLFVGQITDTKIDQQSITFSVVSDMSRRGTSVAGRTVTQRCIFTFNAAGSGVGPSCGWQTTQPGDPTSCDHDLDSPNGCSSHGNTFRYGGVPSFTAFSTEGAGSFGGGLGGGDNGYDPNTGGGGGWGDGSGGGWCVHPETWILCVNKLGRFWVKAMNVHAGETVLSMDKFNRLVSTTVKGVRKGVTTHLYSLTTEKGYGLQCSPSHPIITSFEDYSGTPCHTLEQGNNVLVSSFGADSAESDTITSFEILDRTCNVIIFELEEPLHIFISGSTQSGGILSHNMKPIGGGLGDFNRVPEMNLL